MYERDGQNCLVNDVRREQRRDEGENDDATGSARNDDLSRV